MSAVKPWTELLIMLVSFGVTFSVLPRLANIASRIGLIDYPGKRKVHVRPKPLVGGIGMMMGVSISLLLFVPLLHLRGFYAGLLLLAIVGFLDDFRELDHRWKFYAQIGGAVLMVFASRTELFTFGDLLSLGNISFHSLALPMTIFCTVGVVNAVNMIDGVDGLAGGLSLIAALSFAVLAALNNQSWLVLLSVAFAGALIGFLRYNWHPSRLFMGDAGSLTLGFTLAFLSVAVTQVQGSRVPPVASLLIMAVPIVDTVTVMTRRVLRGKSPFRADKTHLHHILLRSGFSKRQTVLIICALALAFSSLAIAGTLLKIPEYYLFFVFVCYFALCVAASFHVKRLIRSRFGFGRRLLGLATCQGVSSSDTQGGKPQERLRPS